MAPEGAERKLAAILFSDIVGYTALMAESEAQGLHVRQRNREVVRPLLERYHGAQIEETGDEFFCVFPSAMDAVNSALAIQAALRDDPEFELRIGLHLGDVVFEDGRVYGDGVNIASRIRALAQPGAICISDEVHHSIRNQPGISSQPLGEHDLKNVGRPVSTFSVTGVAGPPRGSSTPRAGRDARSRVRVALIAAALIVAAVAGWWLEGGVTEFAPIRSIAVLPLENLSGDPEQEYFADGMTEALIADLAKIGALRVVSRTSAMRYKNSDRSLPEIGRELDVDGIVEGSVIRAGDRVRITAQLIDARTDQHIWAERFDRELRGVLALQSEVARSIAREIRVALTPEEDRQLSSDRAVEPAAHEAYLRGRYFWNKRSGEGLRRAVAYFERAIEEDPDYAAAYAGLADTYALLPAYGVEPAGQVVPKAEAAARKALAIDGSLAAAHASLGWIQAFFHWDWSAAEQSFRRAIELDPRYPTAHLWYGLALRSTGRVREGLAEMERAHQLDPFALVNNRNLGETYAIAGDFDRAIAQLLYTIELDPDFPLTHVSLASAYLRNGEVEKALGSIPPESKHAAWIYARAGKREEALRLLDAYAARAEPDHVVAMSRAIAYAALGDDERAFEWLERAYDVQPIGLSIRLLSNPVLERLRADPRFQDLLRRMNYPGPS